MRKIVQDGDPVLRGIAAAVPEDMFGSKELDGIIDDMAKALDVETDGVAIAAPQVGVPLRLFLVRYDRLLPAAAGTMPEPELGVYINPEFTRSSRRREEMDEGCLLCEAATARPIGMSAPPSGRAPPTARPSSAAEAASSRRSSSTKSTI